MNLSTKVLAGRWNSNIVLLLTAGLISSTALTGCSDAGGYVEPTNLTPVRGKAMLDGEPLAGATINFMPKGSTTGTGGFAITDAEGNFDAQHYSQAGGLEPGNYTVSFSRLLMPDGNPLPEGKDAADVGAVESLPPHLTMPDSTPQPQVLLVTTEPTTANFELSSKMKRR